MLTDVSLEEILIFSWFHHFHADRNSLSGIPAYTVIIIHFHADRNGLTGVPVYTVVIIHFHADRNSQMEIPVYTVLIVLARMLKATELQH